MIDRLHMELDAGKSEAIALALEMAPSMQSDRLLQFRRYWRGHSEGFRRKQQVERTFFAQPWILPLTEPLRSKP
jgi:hypothetical protein